MAWLPSLSLILKFTGGGPVIFNTFSHILDT